jgi:hypothetical protein
VYAAVYDRWGLNELCRNASSSSSFTRFEMLMLEGLALKTGLTQQAIPMRY